MSPQRMHSVGSPPPGTVKRLPWSWSAILAWGGLRGGLSMVLAISLAPAFPERDLVETMTFGVGLTISPLLRLLKVVTPRVIDLQRPA